MAKSLRSKWKRKMRAVKRVRYGEKELVKLKTTLAKDLILLNEDEIKIEKTDEINKEMVEEEITIPATISDDEDIMEIGNNKQPRVYNKKTLKDQFGNYPAWFNSRKIKKMKSKNRSAQRKRLRKIKK